MTPRPTRDARGAILAAATAVFEAQGIDGISMRHLASEIGVSATALYHHFDSKEALVAATCEAGFTEFGARLEAAARAAASPLDAVRALTDVYVDFALERPMHYDVMMIRPHRWAFDIDLNKDPESFAGLVALMEACQSAGQIRPQDPREAAHMIWAAIHGTVSLSLSMPGEIRGLEAGAVRERGRAMVEAVIASLH